MAFIGPYVLEAHVLEVPEHATRMVLMSIPGRYTSDPRGDLAELKRFGAELLVSLVTDEELMRRGVAALPGLVEEAGLRLVRCAVPDRGALRDIGPLCGAIGRAVGVVRAGGIVAVFCMAGLGRTGLFAACTLLALGVEPERAIARVREARPGAIERGEREALVRSFVRAA
jgi:protein-tyrosine phosphatase